MANGQMRSDSPHLTPGGMVQQQQQPVGGGLQQQHRMSHLGPGQQQQLPQQRPPGGVPAGLAPGVMPGRTGSPGTLGQVQSATLPWQQGLLAASRTADFAVLRAVAVSNDPGCSVNPDYWRGPMVFRVCSQPQYYGQPQQPGGMLPHLQGVTCSTAQSVTT